MISLLRKDDIFLAEDDIRFADDAASDIPVDPLLQAVRTAVHLAELVHKDGLGLFSADRAGGEPLLTLHAAIAFTHSVDTIHKMISFQ